MPYISASNLAFSHPGGGPLFQNLTFELPKGSALVVSGANGSGKSTLLDVLAGQREPSAGTVTVSGEMAAGAAPRLRLLPQNIDCFLLGATVSEEIGLSVPEKGRKERGEKILGLASAWGFRDKLESPVESLSGGEKKRLALIGALSGEPLALFLDEPFSGLDWPGALTLAESLARLKKSGETIVAATHEPALLRGFADRFLLLSPEKGHLLAESFGEAAQSFAGYGVRPPGE